MDSSIRIAAGETAGHGTGSDRSWIRRDTRAQVAPTYPMDPLAAAGDVSGLEGRMLKKARSRARLIVASSVELYRELAVSALSLVRR